MKWTLKRKIADGVAFLPLILIFAIPFVAYGVWTADFEREPLKAWVGIAACFLLGALCAVYIYGGSPKVDQTAGDEATTERESRLSA